MALKSGRVGIHPSQVDPITGMLINVPTPGNISFEDLSDAQITNPEVGQTLIYNGTGWKNEFSSISPTTLAALQDVQITDPEDGALLVYDSASDKWVNSVTPPAPIVPDGNTVTPTDDVETWLSCAGIDDKSYTTLSDILADSVTFNALLGDSNANKYMARSTTWASTLCADQYAMTMIGQYDVCCDALLNDTTWYSALSASTYASYVIGHVASGEYIHGANEEVAYYLDGATQVPISNPSTLDAGTYTFGSTIAKNPDSLSSDYTKQIRITPNTVEVVLRPDKSLYWYGYVGSNCEPMNTANGWSNTNGYTIGSFTYNKNSATYNAPSQYIGGIVSKSTLSSSNVVKCIAKMTTSTDFGARVGYNTSKSFTVQNTPTELSDITSTSLAVVSKNAVDNSYAIFETHNGRGCELTAFWCE